MISISKTFFRIIVTILCLCSVFWSVSKYKMDFSQAGIGPIILFLIYLGIVGLLIKKNRNGEFRIKTKEFIMILVALAFGVRLVEILIINTVPASDFSTLINGANKVLDGDFFLAESQRGYWYRYNFQIGFTLYEALMLFLFNTREIMLLKAMNVLWGVGYTLMVFNISKDAFGEKAARISSVLLAMYIPNIIATSVLVNEHIANFFYLTALWMLNKCVKADSDVKVNKTLMLSGFFLAIGRVFKILSNVYLPATIIFILLWATIQYDLKSKIKSIILVVVTYCIVVSAFGFMFNTIGVTEQSIFDHKFKYWAFLVGSNDETNGHRGKFEVDLFNKFYYEWNGDYSKFDEVAKAEISRRYKEEFPIKLVKRWYSKSKEVWTHPDSMVDWSVSTSEDTKKIFYENFHGDKLIAAGSLQLTIIYVLALIACTYALYKKVDEITLFAVAISGFVAGFFFVEIQPRYRFSPFFLIIVLAGLGGALLSDYIEQKLDKFIVVIPKNRGGRIIALTVVTVLFLFSMSKVDLQSNMTSEIHFITYEDECFLHLDLAPNIDQNDVEIAWYLYPKDGEVIKLPYSSHITRGVKLKNGIYDVKAFVKKNGEVFHTIMSKNHRVMLVDTENMELISIAKSQNEHIFIADTGENIDYSFAWYVYKNGETIKKIGYSSEREYRLVMDEIGEYQVKLFVKDLNDTIITMYSDVLVREGE